MARTRVKICGIRTPEGADAAVEAGADAIGFIFVPSSSRHVEPEDAAAIMAGLPPFVTTVGVFVNASLEKFLDIEEDCPTNYVQLQGNEDVTLVRQCGPSLFKAVRFDSGTIRADLERWDSIEEVDAILVDGSAGGAGTAFDWNALKPHLEGLAKPIIVAGGLTPENVGEAIRALRPYAVDVSSGVESAPGVKDPALMRAFCKAVREADAAW